MSRVLYRLYRIQERRQRTPLKPHQAQPAHARMPTGGLSPGPSVLMVATSPIGPTPACDSTSSRKATSRRRRSSTTRSASPLRPATIRRGTDCPAPGSWRCKPACTATRSARCIASWKPTASSKRWRARASMCATSKSPGKSSHRLAPAAGRYPTLTVRCARASMACSMPAAPCSRAATCSPARSTGACAAAPGCWSAPPGKTSAPRC